ncbi:hypothetical protein ACOSQ4_023813 [Xanthoceras sorbifolium]
MLDAMLYGPGSNFLEWRLMWFERTVGGDEFVTVKFTTDWVWVLAQNQDGSIYLIGVDRASFKNFSIVGKHGLAANVNLNDLLIPLEFVEVECYIGLLVTSATFVNIQFKRIGKNILLFFFFFFILCKS